MLLPTSAGGSIAPVINLLARRGITFQRTKTWKESPGPAFDVKLEQIEHALNARHYWARTLVLQFSYHAMTTCPGAPLLPFWPPVPVAPFWARTMYQSPLPSRVL